MRRSRNFLHAVWSGYLATGVVSLVNLLTIPLMLAMLGKPTFGLWSDVLYVTNFANIFDMGLGPSMGRFVTDYKDHRDSGAYASFLKSLLAVGVMQCVLFMAAAAVLLPALPRLMAIGPEQSSQFKLLVALQLGVIAPGFLLRPLGQVLYANQQLAWLNGSAIIAALVSGGVLVGGLKAGWGVYACPASTWAAFLALQGGILFRIVRGRFLPPLRRAAIDLKGLKPLAVFSSNVFVIALGTQLIGFAPALLITRKLGLDALADWAIGTKLMLFAWQLIARTSNASEPIFWEMYARQELPRLRERFLELIRLCACAAALFSAGIVAINPPFIRVWTSGRVEWTTLTDLCLAMWVVLLTAATVANMIAGITKRVAGVKFVFLAEGLVLVGLAYTPRFHVRDQWQVALLLLICVGVFRLPYGLYQIRRDLAIPARTLAVCLAKAAALVLGLVAIGLGLRLATGGLRPVVQVVISAGVYAVLALPIVYGYGLPAGPKQVLRQWAQRFF